MGTVYIEDLIPGMVLSSDVRSRQGRLLFSMGLTLDELSIQTLKFWGVTETLIDGVDQETLDRERVHALDPGLAKAAWEETNRRLSLSDQNHPAVKELKRITFINLVQAGTITPNSRSATVSSTPEPRKRPDLTRLANGSVKLASLPNIVIQALDALKNPNVSYAYVAEIISKDTALSAKLLKLVNSALYGFPEPIETIGRAVTIVGANRLTSLALGVSLISIFGSIPREVLDMHSFWEHSLACGVLARLLAVNAGHPNEERCFVAGLLHDIGRLVMLKDHPGHVAQTIAMAKAEGRPLYEVERDMWSFDHAMLGGRLLASWKFPTSLERAVGEHHQPGVRGIHQDAALIHLADILALSIGLGQSGSPLAPPLQPAVWDHLNIPKSALGAAAAQAQRQLDDIGQILLSGNDAENIKAV
ncbi:MAG: HDOD domain-containing protein [Desulfovibrio sp.]|nr:HDOD domain-containing protein [Desulfovibrio sp.]MBI4958114.1 HDOD domain-containing protein [Desulfovibrio sp.]